MNSYILENLERFGWTPDYRFDPERYRKALEADGHILSEKAHHFLNLWGGLSISVPTFGLGGKPLVDWFHTDAEKATSGIYPIQFRDMEQEVGEAVCPVGEKDCANTIILIGTSGTAYQWWGPTQHSVIMPWQDDDFESLILHLMKTK